MTAPRFKENFEGRIRNLALTPNKPSNSLVPLFEAVSNSLHAIAKRFAKHALESGRITILVERAESSTSIIVKDNGVGLDQENFDAFLTLDTSAKIKIGGKGIGRLSITARSLVTLASEMRFSLKSLVSINRS
jgi:light-regulated signal transduction histidine kinase (bacteriophytochrome)